MNRNLKVEDSIQFLLNGESLWGTLLEINNGFYLVRIDQFPTQNGFTKGDEVIIHEEELLDILPKDKAED